MRILCMAVFLSLCVGCTRFPLYEEYYPAQTTEEHTIGHGALKKRIWRFPSNLGSINIRLFSDSVDSQSNPMFK